MPSFVKVGFAMGADFVDELGVFRIIWYSVEPFEGTDEGVGSLSYGTDRSPKSRNPSSTSDSCERIFLRLNSVAIARYGNMAPVGDS